MPRRHKPLQSKHQRVPRPHESGKVQYASKQAAERAAREVSKYNLDSKLRAYQSPIDGKWYLTSVTKGSDEL